MKFINDLLESIGLGKDKNNLDAHEECEYQAYLAKIYSILKTENNSNTPTTLLVNLEDSIPLIKKYPFLSYRAWQDLCEIYGKEKFAMDIYKARIDTFIDGRYFLELCAANYTLVLPNYHLGYLGEKPMETLHILSEVGFSIGELSEVFHSKVSKIELVKTDK